VWARPAGRLGRAPFAGRLGNQSQFALREPEAAKILCRVVPHGHGHTLSSSTHAGEVR